MKVYEVMEQYKDYKFIICSHDDGCIFNAYRAVCNSWCLNMWVNEFVELSNKTVLIIIY